MFGSRRVIICWLVTSVIYLPFTVFLGPPAFVESFWFFVCGIGLYWALYFSWPWLEKAWVGRVQR